MLQQLLHRVKKLIYWLWNNRYDFVALSSFLLFFYLIIKSQEQQIELSTLTYLLIAIGIALLASRWKEVATFAFGTGGLKAEMRDTLDQADRIIKQMQKLAAINVQFMLESSQSAGRLLNTDQREIRRQEHAHTFRQMLEELGLAENQINDAFQAYSQYERIDYALQIRQILSSENQSKFLDFFPNVHIGNVPSPDEVETFLSTIEDESIETAKGWLEDYKYYVKHNKHRDVEAWINRANL